MKQVTVVFTDSGDIAEIRITEMAKLSPDCKISIGVADEEPKPTSIRLSGPARKASIRSRVYSDMLLRDKLGSAVLSYRGSILRRGDTVQFIDPAVGIQDVICDKMAFADAKWCDRDVAGVIATTVLRELDNKSFDCFAGEVIEDKHKVMFVYGYSRWKKRKRVRK